MIDWLIDCFVFFVWAPSKMLINLLGNRCKLELSMPHIGQIIWSGCWRRWHWSSIVEHIIEFTIIFITHLKTFHNFSDNYWGEDVWISYKCFVLFSKFSSEKWENIQMKSIRFITLQWRRIVGRKMVRLFNNKYLILKSKYKKNTKF